LSPTGDPDQIPQLFLGTKEIQLKEFLVLEMSKTHDDTYPAISPKNFSF